MKKLLILLIISVFASSCVIVHKRTRRLGVRPYHKSHKYPNRHQLKPYFGPGRLMSVASLSLIPGLRPFLYRLWCVRIKISYFTKGLEILNET